jgi:hypothetical protein
MWLPQIIRGFSNVSGFQLGLLNGIPYIVATIFMVLNRRPSDRSGERRWHIAVSAFAGALGFILSAYTHTPRVFSRSAGDRLCGRQGNGRPILGAQHLLPERNGSGGRNCLDQFCRQSGRLCRSGGSRICEEGNRQLCRRCHRSGMRAYHPGMHGCRAAPRRSPASSRINGEFLPRGFRPLKSPRTNRICSIRDISARGFEKSGVGSQESEEESENKENQNSNSEP